MSLLLTGVGVIGSAAAASNYWNPSDHGAGVVLSNADKDATADFGATEGYAVRSVTSHGSGKYYAELVLNFENTNDLFGIANSTYDVITTFNVGDDANSAGYYAGDGIVYENNVANAYGAGAVSGDVLGLAVDITNKKFYVSLNNVYENSGNPVAGTGGYSFAVTGTLFLAHTAGSATQPTTLRTGTGDFTYTPPTGYSAWG